MYVNHGRLPVVQSPAAAAAAAAGASSAVRSPGPAPGIQEANASWAPQVFSAGASTTDKKAGQQTVTGALTSICTGLFCSGVCRATVNMPKCCAGKVLHVHAMNTLTGLHVYAMNTEWHDTEVHTMTVALPAKPIWSG